MSIPVVNLFQFTLFFLCSLLGSYVLSQKKSTPLAGLFFAIGIHAGFIGLESYYGAECFDHASALMLLYGPLLYLTVKSILLVRPQLQNSDALHMTPYALALIAWGLGWMDDYIVTATAVLSLTGYTILSALNLRRFRLVILHTKSSALPDAYIWLRTAVQLFAITGVFMLTRTLLGFFAEEWVINNLDMVFFIIASTWFGVLVFQGLGSSDFIPAIDEEEDEITAHITSNTVRIPNNNHQRIVQRIDVFMAEKKPYVDPQITVKEFAEKLNIPARQLSEVINDQYGMSFSEFVNRARVLETQRLMTAPGWADQSLLDIALAAGFNSKSSFNLMFKRIAGVTPSAYRKRVTAIGW